jgi:O-antigen ligase
MVVFFLLVVIHGRVFRPTTPDLAIIIFILTYSLTAFYSPWRDVAILDVLRLFLFGLGYYIVGRYFMWHPRYRDQFLNDLCISVAGQCFFLGVLGLQNPDRVAQIRLTYGDASPVGFSQLLDVAVGYCVLWLLSGDSRHTWAGYVRMGLLSTAIGFIVLLNATRGTVMSVSCAVAAYVAMTYRSSRGRGRQIIAVVSLVTVVAIAGLALIDMVSPDFEERVAYSMRRLMMNFAGQSFDLDRSAVERLDLMRDGMDAFLENPIIGVGLGGLRPYPHNLFIELLGQGGMLLTAFFSLILGWHAWAAVSLVRADYKREEVAITAGILLISFMHLQVSGSLAFAKTLFLFMGMTGSLWAACRAHPSMETVHTSEHFPGASRRGGTAPSEAK